MSRDGKSFLFAETWACRISRYWFDGPKAGKVEVVIDNLPVIPTISTAPPMAATGWRWSACAAPRSISRSKCRTSANACRAGFRDRTGCFRTSTPGAFSNSPKRARSSPRFGSRRRQSSDGDVHARAQGPPLSGRHLQQPHREIQIAGRRCVLAGYPILLGDKT